MKIGKKNENGKKIQITLSESVMKKLTELCLDKGLKRSSIIALSIDKYHRIEKGERSEHI